MLLKTLTNGYIAQNKWEENYRQTGVHESSWWSKLHIRKEQVAVSNYWSTKHIKYEYCLWRQYRSRLDFPKRQISDSSKLKEFADSNFKLDENGKKFSKEAENTAGKGEIACYEQFLLFPQCFQKTSTADV